MSASGPIWPAQLRRVRELALDDRWLETWSRTTPADVAALRALLKRFDAARTALSRMFDEHDIEHDDEGCPMDDTCTCPNIATFNLGLEGFKP